MRGRDPPDTFRVGTCVRPAGALLSLIITACAVGPAASTPERTVSEPAATPEPSATVAAPTAAESLPPIASLLPTHLGDFELHTFETGRDSLLRLADELGVDPGTLEFAFASEHGERFIQMTVIRVPGKSAQELAEAWGASAYTPNVADVEVTQETIGGEPITVVSSASAGAQVGTFYLVERDETLVVIQAFDREIVEEAIAAVP